MAWGTINGDMASCVIKKSEHGNKTGTYISHIYAYDVVGNSSSAAAPAVELGKKHQHVYTSSIKKPATCTEPGIMLYTCKDNDDSYEEQIPATGHQHTEIRNVKAATCAQEGYTGDTYCRDCNTKLTSGKVLPKTDHTWDSGKITTAATCTSGGIKTYTCVVCKATQTEEVPATGHVNKITKFIKKESCRSDGYTGDIFCQDCGKLLEEGRIIPKTEHAWDEGKVTKQPTTVKTGSKTYTCVNCGTTKTEAIAKLKPQKATPGKIVNDKTTNGVYKVLSDGLSVAFTKPLFKNVSVRVPDTVKVNGITCKVTGISANAFKNNTYIRNITIGKNVTVIGVNTFYGCRNLNKVSGGNGIVKISDRAVNCGNLSSIVIPETVRSIGVQTFYNCKNLRSITVKTSALSSKTVGTRAFTETYNKPNVKVPAKQMTAYKKLLQSKGMSSRAIYKK